MAKGSVGPICGTTENSPIGGCRRLTVGGRRLTQLESSVPGSVSEIEGLAGACSARALKSALPAVVVPACGGNMASSAAFVAAASIRSMPMPSLSFRSSASLLLVTVDVLLPGDVR